MGQYYKAVNIKTGQWLYSHDYDSGIKLMEHSWVGNELLGAAMNLLSPNGLWYKSPIVWAGDYYCEEGETYHYGIVKDKDKLSGIKPMSKAAQRKSFLVNHSTKEYVNYRKLPITKGGINWSINPLSLLTALGNGRGGGDYFEQYPDFDKVGIWAGNILSVEKVVPLDCKEVIFNFCGNERYVEINK